MFDVMTVADMMRDSGFPVLAARYVTEPKNRDKIVRRFNAIMWDQLGLYGDPESIALH